MGALVRRAVTTETETHPKERPSRSTHRRTGRRSVLEEQPLLGDAEWMRDATCAEPHYNGDDWFPTKGSAEATRHAKSVCGRCLCQRDCLAFARLGGHHRGDLGRRDPERAARAREVGQGDRRARRPLGTARDVGSGAHARPGVRRAPLGRDHRRLRAVATGVRWAGDRSIALAARGTNERVPARPTWPPGIAAFR